MSPKIHLLLMMLAPGAAKYSVQCQDLSRTSETAGILELLTRKHGRHLGVVHGCSSSRVRGALQPGNRLSVTWRARIAEHLGVVESELMSARAPQFFERRSSLTGLNAAIAVAAAVLPEREPHEAAYEGGDALLDAIFHMSNLQVAC